MTTVSYTGTINTNGEYQDIETLTGLTLTVGSTYTIQIQNLAHFKVADADFTIDFLTPFQYQHGSDTPTIKTETREIILTVLENAS